MLGEVIDKNSKIPIYHQLYQLIKHKIENGEFKENSIIPSEAEIQEQFDISRITVRRAISDLEHDGYVKKKRGIGTIVLPRKKYRNLSELQSFSGDAKAKGDKPSSIILVCKEIQPSVKVSEKLKIGLEEKVCYLKRLRLLNDKLIGINETYVSLKFGFRITKDNFDSNSSLYEFIEKYGIGLGSADETIEAIMPTKELKRELYIDDHVPIIYKERVTYNEQGIPVEYSENSYIGAEYKYNLFIMKVRGS
ncbi:GntR family transcriptional regulator [Neobacillus kokaensis]|uniref:GntR family transcriptional regulator n=1 Tax=Neobacillus kokaensis TaxID=2759023 RepID=A0ABQ3N132_9BACI|nr:GntR family transcriptional regulator [Neobacillus kokaensis]GHH98630.1 GntR family transcriptional regulator [Neobacillus kokaensis]